MKRLRKTFACIFFLSIVLTGSSMEEGALAAEVSEWLTGWQNIGAETYYFDGEGTMQTGRHVIGEDAYYFDAEGVMQVSAWIKVGGKTYYCDEDGILQTGWMEQEGKKYYFSPESNEMQTGWQKIDGYKYYFAPSGTEKGTLQRNCIVRTKKEGCRYVGEDGALVTSAEITAAVNYVEAHTKDSWANARKLKKCYQALRNGYTYRAFPGTPGAEDLPGYAKYLLVHGRGNCYRYAAGFACIAKVLGYEARVNVGEVTSQYGGMAPHGWAEVKNNGKWCKCDVGMRLYMHTGQTSRQYKRLAGYKLAARKGKASFLQI